MNAEPVIRLYNEYSSSTGNEHDKVISAIMDEAMKGYLPVSRSS